MRLTLEHSRRPPASTSLTCRTTPAAQAIVDLLADRLDAMFLVIPPIKGHVDSGKLLALATLNATRVPQFPNVPTMDELGLPEMTSCDLVRLSRARQDAGARSSTSWCRPSGAAIRHGAQARRSKWARSSHIVGPREFGKAHRPGSPPLRQDRGRGQSRQAKLTSEFCRDGGRISARTFRRSYPGGNEQRAAHHLHQESLQDLRLGVPGAERHQPGHPARRDFRAARPERRRQDHADRRRLRHRQCHRRHGDGRRPRPHPRLSRGARDDRPRAAGADHRRLRDGVGDRAPSAAGCSASRTTRPHREGAQGRCRCGTRRTPRS